MAAIFLQVLLPALRQELVEVAVRVNARMDVAVDDSEPRRCGLLLVEHRAVDDVTHAILLYFFETVRPSAHLSPPGRGRIASTDATRVRALPSLVRPAPPHPALRADLSPLGRGVAPQMWGRISSCLTHPA